MYITSLPNRANTCLHSSISAKFYQFFDSDKHFLSKVFENMVRGPSKVCTSKAVVDETCGRKSTKFCKTIVGIDASRLNPYSLCQPMPEKLYTRYEFDADLQRFKPHQNQSRISENMVMSYSHRMRPDCRIENLWTTRSETKPNCFNSDEFCGHCNTVFEIMGCFYRYCLCQDERPALSEEDIPRGSKKRNGWNQEPVYWKERLHCCQNVGLWIVQTLQDWCVSNGALERMIPIRASIASGPDIGQEELRRTVWLLTVWCEGSKTSKRTICKFLDIFQNYNCM